MRRPAALLLALLLPLPSRAARTTALEFLKVGAGPRYLAQGGAAAAWADDSAAVFWNPAGLGVLDRQDATLAHADWLESFTYENASYAFPFAARWNGAVSAASLRGSGIDAYDNGGAPAGRLGVSQMSAGLSVAGDVGPWFRAGIDRAYWGATVKYLAEDLSAAKATGFALDTGFQTVLYNYPHRWSLDRVQLGAAVMNLGPGLTFDRDEAPLPLVYRAGLSARGWARSLTASLDYEKPLYDPGSLRFGAEYRLFNTLAFRGGYRWALKDNARTLQNGPHVGMGFQIGGAWVDYAFAPFLKLDDAHFIGLRMAFGPSMRLEQVEHRIQEHFHAAQRAYIRNDYALAQRELNHVLTVNPAHPGARFLAEKNKGKLSVIQMDRQLALGQKRLAAADYGQAADLFRGILAAFPDNPEALRLLKETEERINEDKAARREALMKQAEDFFRQGNFEASVDLWEKVLLLDPENETARPALEKARARWEEQKVSAAAASLRERVEKGWVQLKQKNPGRARETALAVLKDAPAHEDAALLLAQANGRLADQKLVEGRKHFQSGHMRKAFASLKDARDFDPANQVVGDLLNKTKAALVQGEREEAIGLYEKQDYTAALEKLEFLISVDPAQQDLVRYREETLRKLGEARQAEAERINREALKAYDSGNLKGAAKLWKQVLELSPGHLSAKRNLERALEQLKENP